MKTLKAGGWLLLPLQTMWLLLLLRSCLAASAPPGGDVVPAAAASAGGPAARQRIAYVTNTWWPKVDGAAITVMGHARYFSEHGHDVLVVRPSYPDDSPVWERAVEAGMASDPVPPSPTLQFLSYRMVGNRGGGFEPEMDASDLSRVEKGLTAWEPNIVLVVALRARGREGARCPGRPRAALAE